MSQRKSIRRTLARWLPAAAAGVALGAVGGVPAGTSPLLMSGFEAGEQNVAEPPALNPKLLALPANVWVELHQPQTADWRRQPHAGAVYDSKRGTLLTFGAETHGRSWDNAVREFDPLTERWYSHQTAADPGSYRAAADGSAVAGPAERPMPWAMHSFDALVYDPSLDALVVSSTPEHNPKSQEITGAQIRNTWIYRLAERRWSPLPNGGRPAPSFFGGASAYDRDRDVVVGYGKPGLWELGPARQRWQLADPQARHTIHHSTVYDRRHRVLLTFGAYQGSSEVWAYRPGATPGVAGVWENRRPGGARPPPDEHLPVAYSDDLGVVLQLIDGRVGSGEQQQTFADSYVYDYAANVQTRLPQARLPQLGYNYMMVYDTRHKVFLLVTGDWREPATVLALRLDLDAPAGAELADCAAAGVDDPARLLGEQRLAEPAPLAWFRDPAFGTCARRITDAAAHGRAVPMYSRLQAWNADGSKILLNDRSVIDAARYAYLRHGPDDGGWGEAPRWSPTLPDVIHSPWQNELRRYDVNDGSFTAVTFPEYQRFVKNPSFEELSADGRYGAYVARRPDGVVETFVYDHRSGVKGRPLVNPDPQLAEQTPLWARISPLGDYLLVLWKSPSRLIAYDRDLRPLGVVANGTGHSDIAVDADGVQWHLDFAAGDGASRPAAAGPVIRKSRLPDGYSAWLGGDDGAVVNLLTLGWGLGGHVSCRGPLGSGWCLVSVYRDRDGAPGRPFAGEIFKLYLDSRDCWSPGGGSCEAAALAPRVERLIHHRSDADCGYWAQPHATISRDGRRALFGSNWADDCEPEDAFLLPLAADAFR